MTDINDLLVPGYEINGRAVVLGKYKAGSAEWHAARANRLGGSEAAVACGLSPWESRFSLFYRKKGKLDDIEITPAIEWGNRLESVVYDKYSESLGPGEVITTGHTYRSLVPGYGWVNANPDGVVWKRDEFGEWQPVRILEIKTSARGEGFGTQESGVIPIYYRIQVLYYAWCFGIGNIELAALISGVDYRVYKVDYDSADVDYILKQCQDFIHKLENDIKPDLSTDTATYEAVRQLNPELDPDMSWELEEDLAVKYLAIEEAYRRLKVLRDGVHAQVIDEVAPARLVKFNDRIIARRQMPGRGDNPYLRYVAPAPDYGTSVIAYARAHGLLVDYDTSDV
ncbi:RecE-like exonuclease [Gordonia Phage JonJames]|nr:RecE-like exonuclease [Gordonia Phage JonJames]